MGHFQIKQLLLIGCFVGISMNGLAGQCDGIPEGRYDTVYSFSHGVAAAQRNGFVGYVDSCGHEVTKVVYTHIASVFGEQTIRYIYNNGLPRYIGWVYDHKLGYSTWVDADGKVLISGTKHTFRVTDKIPDALWNY